MPTDPTWARREAERLAYSFLIADVNYIEPYLALLERAVERLREEDLRADGPTRALLADFDRLKGGSYDTRRTRRTL